MQQVQMSPMLVLQYSCWSLKDVALNQTDRVAEVHCTDSMKGLDVVGDAYVADCGPAVRLLVLQAEVKPLTSNKPQE